MAHPGRLERAEVEGYLPAGLDLAVIASSHTNHRPHGFAIQAPDSVSREALTATAHATVAAGTSSRVRRAALAAPTHNPPAIRPVDHGGFRSFPGHRRLPRLRVNFGPDPVSGKRVGKRRCRTTLRARFSVRCPAVNVTIESTTDTPADPGSEDPIGVRIGYARVSTAGQLLDRQVHALREAGCSRIFTEKLSGRSAERPQLTACLDYLRAGDVLVVPSLDRLSRSLQDLIALVGELRRRGVGFTSLHEALDTTTPGGRLVFHVFAALAEFIRELIVQGTKEGLAAARARGQRLGRPPALSAEQVRYARELLELPENTVSSIARLLGVSRSTLYAHVPGLAADRRLPGGRGLPGALDADA